VTTLATMKSRIASELRRDDLTSDIADAIATAITTYQHEKFHFSQSRSAVTFNTVAGQDIYTSADNAAIARIIKVESAWITIGGLAAQLWPRQAEEIEGCNLGSAALVAQPLNYTFYQESLRLSPIPNDVYAVRFLCVIAIAAPANDSEEGNRWMTDGELLIRSRAKAELYEHIIKKPDQAAIYNAAAERERRRLKLLMNQKTQPEDAIVEAWNPYG
jgi:hypothetical protein